MALLDCRTTTDHTGRELLDHGTPAFPIACYEDDFRETDVPWHWHDELEAAVLTAGSCTVAAGSEKYTLTAGEGFFINSGVLHGCWDTEKTGCMFHSLVFHPRLVGGSLDSILYQRYLQPLMAPSAPKIVTLSPDIPWQKEALKSLETAWQHVSREPSGYEFLVRENLSRFIFQLFGHMPAPVHAPSEKTARDAQRIKTMLSLIHSQFHTELTISQIAASCMISESECLRCFRSTIGISPIQYLKQYRIQQAAQRLLETQEKITDIASGCGFQDMSYFTKCFRELKGRTPSEYRKAAHHESSRRGF